MRRPWSIILATVGLIGVVIFCYFTVIRTFSPVQTNRDPDRGMLEQIFPGRKFTRNDQGYVTTKVEKVDGKSVSETETYYIEQRLGGSFTGLGRRELLAVVRRPEDEMNHAEGFYQAYMAVFDRATMKLASEVKQFYTDKGEYKVLEGKTGAFILWVGNHISQGLPDWENGLWKAGKPWQKIWEAKDAGIEGSLPVAISGEGLKVMKLLTKPNPPSIIPIVVGYKDLYLLQWNRETETFSKAPIKPSNP